MKSLSTASCAGVLALTLAGCQSFPLSDSTSRSGQQGSQQASGSYIARAGETLETIAFRYKIPVATLRELNPDALNGVFTGMRLTIRPPAPGTVQEPTRYSALEGSDNQSERVIADRIAPAPVQRAIPMPAIASDQYLLGNDRYSQSVPELRETRQETPSGYVRQPGFPVEEIIEDEDFVLPDAITSNAEADDGLPIGWQWPLNGQLARDYDPQRANGRGIEIVGMPGARVHATRDGVVDWVARSPDGVGKVVIIRHDDDYLSIYSNAQDLFVTMKDVVRQGDPIASLGANANDEPLLRFEISRNGNLLNPMDFLSPR